MKLKALAAIAVAGIMVMSVPMVAMAATTAHVHHSTRIDSNENSDIQATGYDAGVAAMDTGVNCIVKNVTVENAIAISAQKGATVTADSATNNSDQATVAADNATVTVNGAVTNNGVGNAIKAEKGATVTAGSVVSKGEGIFATDLGTNVTVNGTVIADGTGVHFCDGAKVTVGDVTVSNTTSEEGGIESDGGTIVAGNVVVNSTDRNVNGIFLDTPDADVNITAKNITVDKDNLTSGENTGIFAGNDDGANVSITVNDVYVGGQDGSDIVGIRASVDDGGTSIITVDNLTSNGKGIEVNAEDGSMTIIADGIIKSTTYAVYDKTEDGGTGTYAIITSGIDKGTGEYFNKETVADHVYYFVNTTGGELEGVTAASGDSRTIIDTDTGLTKYAIKENDATIIKVKTVDGYTFKSMSTTNAEAVLTDNGDGTYTLVMPRGGNVSLDLVYEAIKKAQSSGGSTGSAWTSAPTSYGSSSAPVSNGSWSNVNGKSRYTINGELVRNAIAVIQYQAADGQTYTGTFYFDRNGDMATGWQKIDGVWYYFNEATGSTQGMMLVNATTPDGYKVGADGKWIQ